MYNTSNTGESASMAIAIIAVMVSFITITVFISMSTIDVRGWLGKRHKAVDRAEATKRHDTEHDHDEES